MDIESIIHPTYKKFYIHPSSQHLTFPSRDLQEFRKQREKKISNEEWKEIAKIQASDFF